MILNHCIQREMLLGHFSGGQAHLMAQVWMVDQQFDFLSQRLTILYWYQITINTISDHVPQ